MILKQGIGAASALPGSLKSFQIIMKSPLWRVFFAFQSSTDY